MDNAATDLNVGSLAARAVLCYNAGHLPLIEVKISGPHRAGQYLRRALSACFLDFDHYRCRVDFRLCLSARCGNVIESRPESIDPDCSLQSKRLSRLPVSAAHAPYSHHVDGNLGILR